MANYVKQTWTDGVSALSAARMGVVEQGIFDAHFTPAARVFHNAAQSITSGVATVLAFNSERFDTDTIHDTVTNNSRLTCKTAGTYQITATVEYVANATGLRVTDIRLNGATLIARVDMDTSVTGGNTTTQTVSTLYALAVNDYVEVMVIQTSGGALNVNSAANYSPEFMMVRVG